MTEGNLPAALKTLEDAIGRLCDSQRSYADGRLLTSQSLYCQLRDELAGSKGQSKGTAKSQPPIWVDDADLLIVIDRTTRTWNCRPGTTPERLRELMLIHWRPQDCDRLTAMSGSILQWCEQIVALLNPTARWTLPAACPACNIATVMRRDSAGELVRQPALQISKDGCHCINPQCRTSWGPEKFMFLANLLGYEKPSGVLE